MGHEADQDRVPGEPHRRRGEPDPRGHGPTDRPFRWVCGITPVAREGAPDANTSAPEEAPAEPADQPVRVPRQRPGDLVDCLDPPERGAEPEPEIAPAAGCLTDRPGWAAPHRHGAVRPRPRAGRRSRPPGRWC
jgi:hypothetical protein